jgi:putative hydrolase of the HAD superfamily
MIDLIAFDADDTLWHNEIHYRDTEDRFQQILAPYQLDGRASEALYHTEMQNLRLYGFGTKGFALSMIETAIRLTDGQIKGAEVQQIIDLAKGMLATPVQLLEHAPGVVASLSTSHSLMLVTKGDLLDQERKLAQSGLASYFDHVEIVSHKTPDVYRSVLDKHRVVPERFLMVGNSLRSDVAPVVALGGQAVHITYQVTWVHEAALEQPDAHQGYIELEHIGLLPAHVDRLCQQEDGSDGRGG